jgi:3-hydroxybutyryl-CoA dehydrogenase
LAMADAIGLDSLLSDMELMFDALGELQYRPCPLLRRMVREGHLGVKTRQGFFCYDEEGKHVGLPERRSSRNPADAPTIPRELTPDPKTY